VGPRYWAFLSYSSHDRAAARWLQRALETYLVPRRLVGRPTPAGPCPARLRPVFRDRSELAADSDLSARISEALDDSAFLIVVCSPAAAASRWVDEEIARFRARHGEDRILAVIVAGGAEHEACFPAALRYSDHSGHGEPIAADLRPGGDGRRMALLKLVAGMVDVGLDELVQRDNQRRQRQLAGLAAVSLAGMGAMGALALSAVHSRDEARRQRGQAEGLIEFMLTDLRKRVEPSGRLDLMDGIGAKALSYYGAQRPQDLDAGSLGRRARALRLMGEISVQRGQLDQALHDFEGASATTGELMDRAPADGARVFDHAQNRFWVGNIAFERGQGAKAENAFKGYLALANRLTALDPARDDWRAEVVYADTALGALYLDEGRDPEAAQAFSRSLGVSQGLAARHPDDLDHKLDVAMGHAWLGDALEKEGRLGDAGAQRRDQLAVYGAILARDRTVQAASFGAIVAMRALAREALLRGDTAGALTGFTEAARRAEALLAGQKDNMSIANEVAAAQIDLADALLYAGKVDQAAQHQARAASLAATALAADPTVKDWRTYRAHARLIAATIAARRGHPGEALVLDQATLAELTAAPQVGVNTEGRWLVDRARLHAGDDLAALRRPPEARAQWTAAAADLSGPVERYEPRLLMILAAADRRLGRAADARAVGARLAALKAP
jgi:tetratricopeptide (TPR) repeat protein